MFRELAEKTATKIIQQYQTIENAYEHVDELKPPRASKNLKEFWEQAQLSKTLATIKLDSDITFELENARHENPYTKEAHELFQRLEFKNLLGRFDVEASVNDVEKYFREVTGKEEIEKVFKEAEKAETVGVAFSKDAGNVLPLFAHASGYGRVSLCYEAEKIVTIPCDMDADFEYLTGKLSHLAKSVKRFSMCGLKEYLEWLPELTSENGFDAIVAAYLLNPLKNDYNAEDVAREHLNLLID